MPRQSALPCTPQVYAAQQADTGKFVALKVIFLGNPRLDSDAVEVLRQEFALMGRLNHSNIVKIDCAIEDRVRRQVVIAEEICAGGTLLDELQHTDTNDDRMLVVIFKQLFSALEHMHARGILHRDIKPGVLTHAGLMSLWTSSWARSCPQPATMGTRTGSAGLVFCRSARITSKRVPALAENIIFRHEHKHWNDRGAIPVVIDFGMACELRPRQPQRGLMGSPGAALRARSRRVCLACGATHRRCRAIAVFHSFDLAASVWHTVLRTGAAEPLLCFIHSTSQPPPLAAQQRPALIQAGEQEVLACRVCGARGHRGRAAHRRDGRLRDGRHALPLHHGPPADEDEGGERAELRALRGV
jgi:serine/threonine protein kinase